MLFSFEEGDAKGSIIRRRAQRPRRDIDLDKFRQVLRGSASDDLIADLITSFCFTSSYTGCLPVIGSFVTFISDC